MGRSYEDINESVTQFIGEQRMFFVASAPSEGGHVNVSPKGSDTFRVINAHRVAYLDLTGSGIETVSHLRDNGRLTIMFCAFDGKPRIVRLFGTGTVIPLGDAAFAEMAAQFPAKSGARAVIVLDVDRVADSCGFSVPLYDFVGQRDVLDKWSDGRGADGLTEYRLDRNAVSIDGLPAWTPADEPAP